jgi:transposase-like protein
LIRSGGHLRRGGFTDEFKASAVQRVLDGGRTIPQVARDLDLTESALRGWVEQARADAGKGKPGPLTADPAAVYICAGCVELCNDIVAVDMDRR